MAITTARVIRRQVPVWPAGRYKLLEKSEIARQPGGMRELLDAGSEIVWDGMPGAHMEALDAQAAANVDYVNLQLGGFKSLDPTAELTMIVGEVDSADARIAELLAQVEALKANKQGAVASTGALAAQLRPPAPVASDAAFTPPPAPALAADVAPGQGGVRPVAPLPYMAPVPPPPPMLPR